VNPGCGTPRRRVFFDQNQQEDGVALVGINHNRSFHTTSTVHHIMNTKHIVVTGASGYLGQHLLQSLLTTPPPSGQANHITAIYNRCEGFDVAVQEVERPADVTVQTQSLDLTDAEAIDSWKASISRPIDVCVHLAVISSPRACQEDPDQALAINCPKAFFAALENVPIIALSTDHVYDGTKESTTTLYVESDLTNPVNTYGATKVAMEEYLQKHHAFKFVALRSSIIIGPKAPLVIAHATFLHFCESRRDEDTTYFTNEYRTVVSLYHVLNVIDWWIQNIPAMTMFQSESGIYNMGGPHRLNRLEMAKAVFSYFNYDEKYLLPSKQTSEYSPLDISMDSGKLQTMTSLTHQPETMEAVVQATFSAPERIWITLN
jgi:dTDP-4-dehydrorhamnose reductase